MFTSLVWFICCQVWFDKFGTSLSLLLFLCLPSQGTLAGFFLHLASFPLGGNLGYFPVENSGKITNKQTIKHTHTHKQTNKQTYLGCLAGEGEPTDLVGDLALLVGVEGLRSSDTLGTGSRRL